jgi:hypothetical protein
MRGAWSGRGGWSTASARDGDSGRTAVTCARRQRPGAVEATRETDKWAPVIFYLIKLSNTHTLIFEKVIFLMSKFHQMFHRDSWNYKEQLSF